MKMKKYTAESMVDAMKKVRMDFGDDAIILSSNVVKSKGFLGLFKKKVVEVVAGFDEPAPKIEETVFLPISSHTEKDDGASMELKKEMTEMKKMLKDMQQAASHSRFPDEMKPLLTHLEKQGLSVNFITELGENLYDRMKAEKKYFTNEEQLVIVKQFLEREIGDLPFGGISFNKKFINVLGPTGVGKTTTIAKIAARALLENKKKIGFITTDTYRIAAIEQLRTYANLLQAPVEIAYNSTDFEKALEKLADRDLIFIDTAGRNYKETKFVEDLARLIDFSLDMESYLVLSLTSKEEDMRVIVEQFKSFAVEKFIFTKMDETGSIGPMFNLMKDYGIGTAYYTDGQEVPEDITEADSMKLITLLLKGVYDA
ncbi:flagellar biosynthesis protein FlhF [Sporosarcina sp. ANT_H38]|uniref:flagellar biosynthesis protein FlhF n=1 Tax=Sporosarcina sp. ANT_H38 TaxID=2597358 RepID=UPI0011F13612|nr:flagellar biosynthesis protein FlhF [Sporosarcina sp. ANT_H38]KAA0966498.1 flagellar biosynthesis protein FlhF [Sporosarcina sp. ANT_H38]